MSESKNIYITNCKGCEQNPEVEMDKCKESKCEHLCFADKTRELYLIAGSHPGLAVTLSEFNDTQMGVDGGDMIAISVLLPFGPIHLYVDKLEILEFLTGKGNRFPFIDRIREFDELDTSVSN